MVDGTDNSAAVLFRELRTSSPLRIGIATLNAPKSLNALSLDMVRLLDARLQQWAAQTDIACVVLDATGDKAFCAGGDVRALRTAVLAQPGVVPNPVAEAFFSSEYRLDHRIHTYPKPLLVWGGGIVMGGGLGLLVGASHRVVTESSRLAMPEISIGLYPDVGGSWFMQRLPRRSGLFLSLTGASIDGHDAVFAGLADHVLRTEDRAPLMQQLTTLDWTHDVARNRAMLSHALQALAPAAPIAPSNLERRLPLIDALTTGDTLAEVHARILAYAGDDVWLQKAAATLAAGSPSSAGLIWELWRRARTMSLAAVLRMELAVSLQCVAHPDFAEGVRALLVDKDQRPSWTPATLVQLTPDWIAQHFVAPWVLNPLADLPDDVHPLA